MLLVSQFYRVSGCAMYNLIKTKKINWPRSLYRQKCQFLTAFDLKLIWLAVGLISPFSMAQPVSPLIAQDAEREQAERLQQLKQSQQAINDLPPLPKMELGSISPSP